MDLRKALERIGEAQDLTQSQSKAVFDSIMRGEASSAQIAAVLMGLRVKGETVAEIAGAANAMREVSLRVSVEVPHLVDTCGTGGSGSNKLFNISTASAFVAAAAGAHVAKHGNRAVTGPSGSTDVLEAAGIHSSLGPEKIAQCICHVGVGFLFAPAFHPAMRFAGPVRKELGVRTLFNLLGPLTNPANTPNQVLGVSHARWQEPLAKVSELLGSERVLIVHASGLDEISVAGPTRIVELSGGVIHDYMIEPKDFGIGTFDVSSLRARNAKESLALVEAALDGSVASASAVVALNGGAAIYASGIASSLADGVERARNAIESGKAKDKLERLRSFIEAS